MPVRRWTPPASENAASWVATPAVVKHGFRRPFPSPSIRALHDRAAMIEIEAIGADLRLVLILPTAARYGSAAMFMSTFFPLI